MRYLLFIWLPRERGLNTYLRNAFEIILCRGFLIVQKRKFPLGQGVCLSWYVLKGILISNNGFNNLGQGGESAVFLSLQAPVNAFNDDNCEFLNKSCCYTWYGWYFLSGSFVFQMQPRLGLHEASVSTLCCVVWLDCSSAFSALFSIVVVEKLERS